LRSKKVSKDLAMRAAGDRVCAG